MHRLATTAPLFCAVVLSLSAPQLTEAQIAEQPLDMRVTTNMRVRVTSNGSTEDCFNIESTSSTVTLEPIIGDVKWAERDLVCGNIRIIVMDKYEVRSLRADGHIIPYEMGLATAVHVVYPDGTAVEVLDRVFNNSFTVPETGGYQFYFTPVNTPGVVIDWARHNFFAGS